MSRKQDYFEFKWWRCPKGYQVIGPTREKSTNLARKSILTGNYPQEEMIQAVNSKYEIYSPFEVAPDLHRALADWKTGVEGALSFTEQYGILVGRLDEAQKFGTQEETNFTREMSTRYFKKFREAVQNVLVSLEKSNVDALEVYKQTFGISKTRCHVLLQRSPNGRIITKIVPSSLSDYISLRLATEISGDVERRICAAPGCNEVISIAHGPGTTSKLGVHTVRKKTCSEKCKKRLWRSEKKLASAHQT